MANPIIQDAGTTFSSQPSGNIGVVGQTGTCTTATSSALTVLTFNPQTTGTGGGSIAKGTYCVLGSNGHAPDIIASVTSSTAVTILTNTSGSNSGVSVQMFPGYIPLISGEASAITNTDTLISSYFVGNNGTGGIINQTDCANATYMDVFFVAGGSFTPTAGGYIALWFLESADGGSTFEKNVSNTAVPRAPDCIIPTYASAYSAADKSWSKGVLVPACPFKVFFQNETGATMPSTWGIWGIPQAVQLTN